MGFHMDPDLGDLIGGMVAGDTSIALMDGNHCTIAEAVEDLQNGVHHIVCALGLDGRLHIARLNFARRVDGDAKVLTVTLDDGSVIHCTPGQLLLAPSGDWHEAQSLCPGDALLTVHQPHQWLDKHIDKASQPNTNRLVAGVEVSGTRSVYEFHIDTVHNVAHPTGVFLHD